jgi:hypothetical protein
VSTDKFKHGQPIKVEDAFTKKATRRTKKKANNGSPFLQPRLKGRHFSHILAERTGLEPATPGVTGRYSNQLNYRSKIVYFANRFIRPDIGTGIRGGADGTRTRDPRRDRPVF